MKKKTKTTAETPRNEATLGPEDCDVDLEDDGSWIGGGLRFREFTVMISTSTAARLAGIGLDLEDVVEYHQQQYRRTHARIAKRVTDGEPGGSTPAELAADSADLVVWEGARVVAVLVPYPDGRTEYRVTRFDD